MNETPEGYVDVDVQVEYAPVGVQLWPTRTPEQGINFTLRSVAVVRQDGREWVVWTYENNKVRSFQLGETMVCRLLTEDAAKVRPFQFRLDLTDDEQAAVRDALRFVLYGVAPQELTPQRLELMRGTLERMKEQM